MLTDLIILDLETTGTDIYRDHIIEFGAWSIKDGVAVEKKQFYIRPPDMEISANISKLTGISKNELANAGTFHDYRQEIIEFLGTHTLVAHNSKFDLVFLERSMGLKLTNDVWDTLELARVFFPGAGKYRLESLARFLKLDLEEPFAFHRALNDAWVSWRILESCWQKGSNFDLSFYVQAQGLFQGIGSQRFFSLLEKEIIRNYPGRPIKTGIVLSEEGDLFTQIEKANDLPHDESWVSACFDHQGVLEENLAGYESRQGQKDMAELITGALIHSERIVIEAGTGIGKSFAYLIPSLWWARKVRRKIIVATHTIPLQEQLDKKDLPVLKEVLPFSFRAALLKGRGNYLCLRNWLYQLKNSQELSPEERITALSISVWLRETRSGDLQELSHDPSQQRLWYQLNAENDCLSHKCAQASKCFLLRAKEKAESADIIIVNHSLLLSDLKTGFNILPNYSELIIDEAHHLYHSALKHLGWELSSSKVMHLMDQLVHSGKNSFYYSAKSQLGSLREEFSGLSLEKFTQLLEQLPKQKELIVDQVRHFFELLNQSLGSQTTIRLRPEDQHSGWWKTVEVNFENLHLRFQELNQLLKGLTNLLEGEGDELELIRFEIQGYRRQVEEIIEGLRRTSQIEDTTWVRWLEQVRGHVHLKTSPVEVDSILQDKLFSKLKSVILTSATLSIAGQFGHFLKEIGLPAETQTAIINSPFDYDKQMSFFVVSDFISYHEEDRLVDQTAEFIGEVCQILKGRTLVLFTSHYLLRAVNKRLQELLVFSAIDVYAQGVEGNRRTILEAFINNPQAVLLGANSFWEGIDLPGDTLSCVIIVKLPFSPPSLPLIEARSELLKAAGQNPFQDLLLPEAIIRFKQGFGRLIRRKSDNGLIILLDSRPLQKSYGKLVFSSLPIRSYYRGNKGFVLRKIEEWNQEKTLE